MATMVDGLGREEVSPSGLTVSGTALAQSMYMLGSLTTINQISGANIYSTGALKGENVYGDTVVSGATVKGTTVNNTDGELQSVAVGSPSSVFGAYIQAGSGTLDSDSGLWLTFPTAFTGQPTVVVSNITSISSVVSVGSVSTGSCMAFGETAADEFSWIAVGL